MLELKACPRCKGDMHTNRDMYGSYKECLQCGPYAGRGGPEQVVVAPGIRNQEERRVTEANSA